MAKQEVAAAPAHAASTRAGNAVDGQQATVAPNAAPAAGRVSGHGLLALQQAAGNAAVQALLLPVQRDGPDGGVPATAVDAGVPLPGGIEETPRQQIDRAMSDRSSAAIEGVSDWAPATDGERLASLRRLVELSNSEGAKTSTMYRIWQSLGSNLPRVASDESALWEQCNVLGAGLPESWLGAGAGHVTTEATEQVGSWTYVVRGAFDYRIMADRIKVKVSYNFVPDEGVSVPTATWFGYIRTTWNHYSAVNQTDPTQKRCIEFEPVADSGGHRVQVKAGNGRANAGCYYAADSRAPQTIPHEFGHHIGLEDEYERDAADYRRVTGEEPAAGDGKAEPAQAIAKELRAALFLEEDLFEWHSTATQRRRDALEAVMTKHHLPVASSTARGRQVAREYESLYGHPISRDLAEQCDTDSFWGASQAWRDWRERVATAFQFTNDSIMGDMSDHSHPVEPRHVRRFADLVQDFLGHGAWQPVQDH